MNLDMSAILMAKILSFVIGVIAILLGFTRGRIEGVVIFIVFVAITVCGWLYFAELLIGWYTESALFERTAHWAGRSFPRLVTTWIEFASWASVMVGALTSWIVLVAIGLLTPKKKIIRGAKLMHRVEMKNAINRKGRSKISVMIGEYAIPTRLEMRCLLLCGEPGTGKTQLILKMILALLRRNDPFVCIDVGGDIYRKLGRIGDVVLSAVHKGIDTSPFADIRIKTDCRLIANFLIALGFGDSKVWCEYARHVLTIIFEKCLEQGKTTNRDLIYYAAYASRDELRELLKGTTAQRLFDGANEKKIDDILGIVSEAIKPLELLNPDAGHKSFSIRNWISGTHRKGNLWIIYDDASAASTAPLRNMWINLMITEGFGLEPSSERRIWIFLDELASNGKIESLPHAVSKLRKYGISLTIAFQNINQLYSLYGQDETKSIVGSVGHAVILRTPDPDTAEYLSRSIGDGEVLVESRTVNDRKGVSTSTKAEPRRSVLPSEIMELDDLRGYIKIASVGWSQLQIPVIDLPNVNQLNKCQPLPALKDRTQKESVVDLDEI